MPRHSSPRRLRARSRVVAVEQPARLQRREHRVQRQPADLAHPVAGALRRAAGRSRPPVRWSCQRQQRRRPGARSRAPTARATRAACSARPPATRAGRRRSQAAGDGRAHAVARSRRPTAPPSPAAGCAMPSGAPPLATIGPWRSTSTRLRRAGALVDREEQADQACASPRTSRIASRRSRRRSGRSARAGTRRCRSARMPRHAEDPHRDGPALRPPAWRRPRPGRP